MHTRYMDRSSSIAREKRALDPGNGSEDVQPEKKRPALARRSDAFQALKKYDNVQLDGKPMNIEIVATNSQVPVLARVNVGRVNGKRTVVMNGGQGLARPRNGGAPPANWGFGRRGQSSRGGRGRGGGGQGRG